VIGAPVGSIATFAPPGNERSVGVDAVVLTAAWIGMGVKPTSGFEPLTPSLRGPRGVCRWLLYSAQTTSDKRVPADWPATVLRSAQGGVLPASCRLRVSGTGAYRPDSHVPEPLARGPRHLGDPCAISARSRGIILIDGLFDLIDAVSRMMFPVLVLSVLPVPAQHRCGRGGAIARQLAA
jgi:hypothetical protein